MIRYTLYLPSECEPGGDPDAHRFAFEDALQAIRDVFGGYTLTSAQGEWRDDNGLFASERVAVVAVLHDLESADVGATAGLSIIEDIARRFKFAASQDVVLYTHESISGRFV